MEMLGQCPCSGGSAGNGLDPIVLVAFLAGLWAFGHWVGYVWRKEGVSRMSKVGKIGIVVVLVLVVGIVLALKTSSGHDAAAHEPKANATGSVAGVSRAGESPATAPVTAGLPRMVDLGAGKCIPCKMMAPILEELKKEYKDKFEVVFIDVWEDRQAGAQYGIRVIPTQIFYDAAGKERFRHEGFFSKEDILGKWKELGVDVK